MTNFRLLFDRLIFKWYGKQGQLLEHGNVVPVLFYTFATNEWGKFDISGK